MRLGQSLRAKILLRAGVNLLLLLAALALFIRWQFEMGPESILMAPGKARVGMLGDQLIGELAETPLDERNRMLAGLEAKTGLSLGLFYSNGQPAGGSIDRVPARVRKELLRPGQEHAELRPPDVGPRMPTRPHRKREGDKPPPGPPQPHPIFMVKDDGQYFVGVRIPILQPGNEFPYVGTLVLRSPTLLFNPFLFDISPWIVGPLVLFLLTLACWAPFVRSLTGSLSKVTLTAEEIAQGKFDVKLSTDRGDEIDDLSEALNRMAAQLDGFVFGQKRFLGDIAHELTAPIARAQMALGILEERAEEAQRDYVEGLHEDVQHMSGLVTELLNFSKAGLVASKAELVPVRVGELAGRVLQREVTPGATVELAEGSDLEVLCQKESIFRALSNVVRNAIRYAGAQGPITIRAKKSDEQIVIVVEDSGPGLPEEALDKVFAPFYRVDRSRSRDSGGVGLGLAIVKACVESSGGRAYCRNRRPRGLEVCIALPAADPG